MSIFSSLFNSGTAFYGDPFGPIVDTISDWGWSLLPQFPGSVGRSEGSSRSRPTVDPTASPAVVPVEIVYGREPGVGEAAAGVYPVFARPEPTRRVEVPREIVVVGDTATEVERHPEGDFPAGSIFAPGQAWEPTFDARPEPEEKDVSLSSAFDWILDTVTGQQEWQTFGQPQPAIDPRMYMAGMDRSMPVPSGIPGQPTTVYGYSEGRAVTGSGDNCGNRRYVTLDRETGKISCKRRRRRRLLTNRDLADLASLKTITGGGAALNSAVIRAVR